MRKPLYIFAITAALTALPGGAHAQQAYAKAGFLGAGVGYAHGINEAFTLRGDLSTIGTYHRNGSSGSFDYKGSFRNNQATVYLDYFPFNNGWRLTAGLGFRDTRLRGDGRPNSAGQITIGDQTVDFGAGDYARATVKLPTVAPYLGLGWGHNVGQYRSAGWGFIADVGVSFGKPKVSFDTNDRIRALVGDDEVRKQEDDLNDKFKKYKLFPSVYVGLSYAF